ncbi:MSHA biogenesis protein MshJ [Alteromonadaceae bacterium Bs31]|nr:MSHA biogenesis protein MshJ [Alteromonadaceae bacterium Bs31]
MSASLKLKERWALVTEKFSGLQMREKILVAASILLVIYLIWSMAIAAPLDKKRDQLVKRFEGANRELQLLTAQEKVMVKALSSDPNAAKRREVLRLERQLESADLKLQQMSVGLLAAEDLPQVLHDVLAQSSRMRLLGMQSIAPRKLELLAQEEQEESASETDEEAEAVAKVETSQATSDAEKALLEEEQIVGVYKHAVRVSLQGEYFSVVKYLKSLEALPWRFYWEFIDYEVDAYPSAKITLEVYTLSTSKGVLGV